MGIVFRAWLGIVIRASILTLLPASVYANKIIYAGYILNGKELDGIDIISRDDQYYIPFARFITSINIQPKEHDKSWVFPTPLGNAELNQNEIISIENIDYIRLAAIEELGIAAKFNQSLYAVQINLPWNRISSKKITSASNDQNYDEIDFLPQSFSINNISIDGGYAYKNSSDDNIESASILDFALGVTGNAFEGLWGVELHSNKDFHADTDNTNHISELTNVYWTKAYANTSFRLGTTQPSFNHNSTFYTGLTLGYSNKDIYFHLDNPDSGSSSIFSGYSRDIRNIKGVGPAGGIAELRVNGQILGRVRIALDKQYEFIGLELDGNTILVQDVKVYLYKHSLNEPPIRIDRPNLNKRHSRVRTDELIFEFGFGKSGNIFSDDMQHSSYPDTDKDSFFSHFYSEYGLNNSFVLRGGATYKSDISEQDNRINEQSGMGYSLGFNLGMTPRLNWDVEYQYSDVLSRFKSYLDYHSNRITAVYSFEFNESEHLEKLDDEISRIHQLDISLAPFEWLETGIGATIEDTNGHESHYFTASLNASLSDNLQANLYRNRDNIYDYGIYWALPKLSSRFSLTGNEDFFELSASRYWLSTTEISAMFRKEKEHASPIYGLSASYQPSEKNHFNATFTQSAQDLGYGLGWEHAPNKYSRFIIGYQGGLRDTNTVSGFQGSIQDNNFYLGFNMLLNKTPTHGLQLGHQLIDRHGTIVIALVIKYENARHIKLFNKDRLTLTLNGKDVVARKIGQHLYSIERVKSGIYEIKLPLDTLPIDYQNSSALTARIKVTSSIRTNVIFEVLKTVGVAGQLQSEHKNTVIKIFHNGELVKTARSRAYGFFQIIGLKPGQYRIQANGHEPVNITLEEGVKFGIKLNLVNNNKSIEKRE